MENKKSDERDLSQTKKTDEHQDAPVKPDPETLGKTDPQEDMEGPVSSLMQKGSKAMESDESKEKADKRHDENM